MEERQTLKPCPFCGSISVDIMETIRNPTLYSVECRGCDCSTNVYYSREEAVNAWNTRTPHELDPKSLLMMIKSHVEYALETQSQYEFSFLCGECNGLLEWFSSTQNSKVSDTFQKISRTRIHERDDLEKLQSLIQSFLISD